MYFGFGNKDATFVLEVEEESEKLQVSGKTKDFIYLEDFPTLHPACLRTRFTLSKHIIMKKCTDTVWRVESGASTMKSDLIIKTATISFYLIILRQLFCVSRFDFIIPRDLFQACGEQNLPW